jgi:hypothetical protein
VPLALQPAPPRQRRRGRPHPPARRPGLKTAGRRPAARLDQRPGRRRSGPGRAGLTFLRGASACRPGPSTCRLRAGRPSSR